MSSRIQFRRGYYSQSYVPDNGEPYYILDTGELRVGDGATVNGVGWMSRPINSTYNIYVSPSGSATASGLSPDNTTTIASAINKARVMNWNGFNTVTIQLSDGTYVVSQSIAWNERKNGALTLRGNPTSPQNVVIVSNYTQSWGGLINVSDGGFMYINGVSLQTTFADNSSNYQVAIGVYNNGWALADNIRFGGVWNRAVQSGEQSFLATGGKLEFYGKTRDVAFYAYRGSEIMFYNSTMSFSGTPTIGSYFLSATEGSVINNYNSMYYTGSRNISYKYNIAQFGVIRNASQYPGTTTNTSSMTVGVIA